MRRCFGRATLTSLPHRMLPVVQPGGTIFPITVSGSELNVPAMPIMLAGIRVQGSMPCSRGLHVKMLRFAALHDIRPIVEEFPMSVDGIEDAMARLEEGRMRYRAVLVA